MRHLGVECWAAAAASLPFLVQQRLERPQAAHHSTLNPKPLNIAHRMSWHGEAILPLDEGWAEGGWRVEWMVQNDF